MAVGGWLLLDVRRLVRGALLLGAVLTALVTLVANKAGFSADGPGDSERAAGLGPPAGIGSGVFAVCGRTLVLGAAHGRAVLARYPLPVTGRAAAFGFDGAPGRGRLLKSKTLVWPSCCSTARAASVLTTAEAVPDSFALPLLKS